MALPDSGAVEDYTEAEMNELLATDKTALTKNQKAATARYNFKKNKGEPIPFKGTAAAVKKSASPAAAPPPVDIISSLAPEIQELAKRDPATLSKEEKIALAKAKSQAVRAQAASGAAPAGAPKPSGPSAEQLAHDKALGFAHVKDLQSRFATAIDGWQMQTDKPCGVVKSERILDVVRYLHMEMGFDQIRDLTAIDWPDRLEVVYNLYRHTDRTHIALKCKLPRDAPAGADMPFLPSIVPVYAGADWLEREVFDLFGIRFSGHPYMRRLLLPDGWVGFPLRKDYDSKKEQFVGMSDAGDDIVSFDSSQGW